MRAARPVSRREVALWNIGVLLLLVLLVLWVGLPLRAAEQDRRSAADRTPTATAQAAPVTEFTFTSPTNWAFLATGVNFPDALGVSGIAGSLLGPTLLVQQNSIPSQTLAELDRLQPEHVRIIGGTAVISDVVLTQVQSLPYTVDVQRIAGSNRYATASEVSKAFYPMTGWFPRAGFSASEDLDDGAGEPVEALSLGLFHSGDGVILIDAGVDVTTPSAGVVECWIEIDGVVVPGSERWQEVDGEGTCATQAATVVGAGSYFVDLIVNAPANADLFDGTLWAIHTPFQQDGDVISPD